MKKFLHLIFLTFLFSISFAQTKEELTSAINIISKKISFQNQADISPETVAELAYLKRTNDLPALNINFSKYILGLNDYYYKRFYLYRKFLDDDAAITEDCFSESENSNMHKARRLIFYSIYPNSMKMPADIIDQLEEYSTVDKFLGPYNSLNTIYFLKKYNYNNLTVAQKEKLATLEKFLCKLLYTTYVENKSWSYYKFLSLKVLRMNNSEFGKDINISDLVKYINLDQPLQLAETDRNDTELMKQVGYKMMYEYETNSVLWIFLLELKKN